MHPLLSLVRPACEGRGESEKAQFYAHKDANNIATVAHAGAQIHDLGPHLIERSIGGQISRLAQHHFVDCLAALVLEVQRLPGYYNVLCCIDLRGSDRSHTAMNAGVDADQPRS